MRKILLIRRVVGGTPPPRRSCLAFARRTRHGSSRSLQGIDAPRAEFAAQSGGTTVYFGAESSVSTVRREPILTAQATWLRRHPEVVARIEGYGDLGDTRDHALAVGARRAEEARTYLVLLGVPAAQLSATSWGKERPGLGRAVTIFVR